MVTGAGLPPISWEENFGPEDEIRVSSVIVETITRALAAPAERRQRLFFIVPTPTPYAKAESALLAAAVAAGMAAKDLRVLALPHGGRCYAVSGEAGLRMLVPHAFRLGPPELTFIAANCGFDLGAPEADIARFVLDALRSEPSAAKRDLAGLHFDSGDLVESF